MTGIELNPKSMTGIELKPKSNQVALLHHAQMINDLRARQQAMRRSGADVTVCTDGFGVGDEVSTLVFTSGMCMCACYTHTHTYHMHTHWTEHIPYVPNP